MFPLVNVTVSFMQGHPLLSACIVARSPQTITKPHAINAHYHLCMKVALLVTPITVEDATLTFTKLTYLKNPHPSY